MHEKPPPTVRRWAAACAAFGSDLWDGAVELCYPGQCAFCFGGLGEQATQSNFECAVRNDLVRTSQGALPRPRDRALCLECVNILASTWIRNSCFGCGREVAHSGTIAGVASREVDENAATAHSKGSVGGDPHVGSRIQPASETCEAGQYEASLSDRSIFCPNCQDHSSSIDRVIALASYQDAMREAVIASKYGYHAPLAMTLGRMLGRKICQELRAEPIHCVTYIPSHWTRRCARGGTPTQLMASQVAKQLHVPLRTLLRTNRKTRKQGTLRDEERVENVRGAFGVKKRYAAAPGVVLVVDDVWTSGATLREVARILKLSGTKKVFSAVVARAVGQHRV